MGRVEWWRVAGEDVRYALRALRRTPGLSLTIIATLALGIGANAAMYSLLERILLRAPAGIADPGALHRVYVGHHRRASRELFTSRAMSYAHFQALAGAAGPNVRLAAYVMVSQVHLGNGEDAPQINVNYASPGYFRVLGVRSEAGRFFAPDEEHAGAPAPVAVVSDRVWKQYLGGSRAALGQTIQLDKERFTVIGVAAPGFTGTDYDAADVWLPLGSSIDRESGAQVWYLSPHTWAMNVLVRLASAAAIGRFDAVSTVALRRLESQDRYGDSLVIAHAGPLLTARSSALERPEVAVGARLLGVAAIVLLIACANVANLLLARGVARRREIAIRVALGISRARLLALLLSESLLLALGAGAAAVVVGASSAAALRRLLFPDVHWGAGTLDWSVVIVTALVALTTGVVAGLAPALRESRPDLASALKSGAREGTFQRSRLRAALVLVQASFSVVLLVGAGLFIRSLRQVEQRDIGLDASRLAYALVRFDADSATRAARQAALASAMPEILNRLQRLPGVERVALATVAPLSGVAYVDQIFLPRRDSIPTIPSGPPSWTGVSPEFFAATGLRIERGRAFDAGDRAGAPRVLIVNATMARVFWPGENPLGQCVLLVSRAGPCFTVVGVVENSVRFQVIGDPTMQYFLPLPQVPFPGYSPQDIIVRAEPDRQATVLPAVRRAILQDLPSADVRLERVSDLLAPEYRPWRMGATLFSAFGLLALLVAAIGVYSTVSYTVGQRRHEFGVRIALGAQSVDVLRLVMRQGLRVVAAGVAVGVLLALAAGRMVASLLYATSPRDPLVLILVALVLLVVAVAASLVPARRASRVDPMEALRAE